MAATVESLLTGVQRLLGIQQAQTILPDNLAGDTIARLTGQRGNIRRVLSLWPSAVAAGPDLADGWRRDEHEEPLSTLRTMIDGSLVTGRWQNGSPRSLRPLSPLLVTRDQPTTVFRSVGLSTVDGLWAGEADLKAKLTPRVRSWQERHPLANLLARLCEPVPLERGGPPSSHLGQVLRDPAQPDLAKWHKEVVLDDWRHWLAATEPLSPDEQLDAFVALLGLHLHLAFLRRLAHVTAPGPAPFIFVAVDSLRVNAACRRAATGFLAFWRERVGAAFRVAAEAEVDRLARDVQALGSALSSGNWPALGVFCAEAVVGFDKSTRGPGNRFRQAINSALASRTGAPPASKDARSLVVEALVDAFSGPSSAADKVKAYHRVTGSAAGLVGPNDKGLRKRYLLEDRALEVLARLHVARQKDARAQDDPCSLEAFLDELFDRYGIVVTTERPCIRAAMDKFDVLRRVLPDQEGSRHNLVQLERRLEALRLIRRFSDASAVLRVTE